MSNKVFFTGLDNMKQATSGGYVSLEAGESMVVKFLDDVDGEHPMAQYYEHYLDIDDGTSVPCTKNVYGNCPLDEHNKPRYRVLVNVVNCKTGEVLILRKGKEFISECIAPYVKEYGTITDRCYKLRGENRKVGSNTYVAYTMVPVDLPKDYPDIDYSKLKRVDWDIYLIVPKAAYVQELADKLANHVVEKQTPF